MKNKKRLLHYATIPIVKKLINTPDDNTDTPKLNQKKPRGRKKKKNDSEDSKS
jgi:hypothetical protein